MAFIWQARYIISMCLRMKLPVPLKPKCHVSDIRFLCIMQEHRRWGTAQLKALYSCSKLRNNKTLVVAYLSSWEHACISHKTSHYMRNTTKFPPAKRWVLICCWKLDMDTIFGANKCEWVVWRYLIWNYKKMFTTTCGWRNTLESVRLGIVGSCHVVYWWCRNIWVDGWQFKNWWRSTLYGDFQFNNMLFIIELFSI